MKISKGQIIALTDGEYSDYALRDHVRAVMDFDTDAEVFRFKETALYGDGHGSIERFAAWLIRESILEPLPEDAAVVEWHLGGYYLEPDNDADRELLRQQEEERLQRYGKGGGYGATGATGMAAPSIGTGATGYAGGPESSAAPTPFEMVYFEGGIANGLMVPIAPLSSVAGNVIDPRDGTYRDSGQRTSCHMRIFRWELPK